MASLNFYNTKYKGNKMELSSVYSNLMMRLKLGQTLQKSRWEFLCEIEILLAVERYRGKVLIEYSAAEP